MPGPVPGATLGGCHLTVPSLSPVCPLPVPSLSPPCPHTVPRLSPQYPHTVPWPSLAVTSLSPPCPLAVPCLSPAIEDEYSGPKLEDGKVTLSFMKDLMQWYKDQKKLHRKCAYQVPPKKPPRTKKHPQNPPPTPKKIPVLSPDCPHMSPPRRSWCR